MRLHPRPPQQSPQRPRAPPPRQFPQRESSALMLTRKSWSGRPRQGLVCQEPSSQLSSHRALTRPEKVSFEKLFYGRCCRGNARRSDAASASSLSTAKVKTFGIPEPQVRQTAWVQVPLRSAPWLPTPSMATDVGTRAATEFSTGSLTALKEPGAKRFFTTRQCILFRWLSTNIQMEILSQAVFWAKGKLPSSETSWVAVCLQQRLVINLLCRQPRELRSNMDSQPRTTGTHILSRVSPETPHSAQRIHITTQSDSCLLRSYSLTSGSNRSTNSSPAYKTSAGRKRSESPSAWTGATGTTQALCLT